MRPLYNDTYTRSHAGGARFPSRVNSEDAVRRIFIITILTAAAAVAAPAGAAAGVLGTYPADGLFFSATETSLLFNTASLPAVSDSFDSQLPAVFQTGFHNLLDEPPLADNYLADNYEESRSLPMTIPAPPATGLLILQGMLCVGLLKGRQKWAAAFVAAMALGRAGIEALPRADYIRVRRDAAAPAMPFDSAAWQPQLQPSKAYYPADFAGLVRSLPERGTRYKSNSTLHNIQTFLEREAVLFDAQVDAERFFHASRSVLVLASEHSLKDMEVNRIHWARPPPC